MPEPPIPSANRLRPPSWRDKRLLVGLVLVLGSVVLGAAVVARADDTEPMYAASHVLVPGQALTAADVHLVRVQLGAQSGHYLSAGRALAGGRVVVHAVAPGELVPVTAVGSQDDVDLRPVPVPIVAGSADGVKAGSVVDVWVAQVGKSPSSYAPPTKMVTAAEVAAVSDRGGVLSTGSTTTISLLLSEPLIPEVLAAVDNGARISLVPAPGSVPRGGS